MRWLAVATLVVFTGARADLLLDEVKRLLGEGRNEQAMEILASEHALRAGIPDYDFYYALTAMRVGRPSLAIEPLRRLTEADPLDMKAHALLGRAYFMTGQLELAERAFVELRLLSPPPAVLRIVDQYLLAIYARLGKLPGVKPPPATRWSGYVEVGAGYDDNANRATNVDTFALPLFGNLEVTLLPTSLKTGSAFLSTTVAGEVRHRLKPGLTLLGDARYLRQQWTADRARSFDQDTLGVDAGVAWTRDRDTLSALLGVQWFRVDNALFQRGAGATLQWSRLLDSRSRAEVFFRLADLAYYPRSRQSIRDVTQYLAGAGYTRVVGERGDLVVHARVHLGTDREQASSAEYLGRNFFGLRAGVDWSFRPDTRAFAAATVERSDYGGREPLFLRARDDTLYRLTAGLAWNVRKRWLVTPSLSYLRNDSNIVTSDYDSLSATLSVRYSF